jgi:hypothetical protein
VIAPAVSAPAVPATGARVPGLDTSLVNVGLDTTAHNLSASLAATRWIASGYLLALAATLPPAEPQDQSVRLRWTMAA